jgi:hypothetical protein
MAAMSVFFIGIIASKARLACRRNSSVGHVYFANVAGPRWLILGAVDVPQSSFRVILTG